MIDYEKILLQNYSQKAWSFSGNSYENLIWLDDSPKPTKDELDLQWTTVEQYIKSKEYIAKRASEYPPITDYLDGIVKGDTEQVQDYIDACLAVKAKYPKPE